MSVKLLKAEAVAEILDVSVQRVWELTRENSIPHIKIGQRQFRYSEPALMNWLENGGTQTATEEQGGNQCLTLSK